jgi:hypothetical protein
MRTPPESENTIETEFPLRTSDAPDTVPPRNIEDTTIQASSPNNLSFMVNAPPSCATIGAIQSQSTLLFKYFLYKFS